jgi:RNA polymerase sigma-70 factor (sigma-E family)
VESSGFGGFYVARKDVVFRATLAAGGDRQVAEDAVAEAFTRAYARWAQVRAHPNPTAWVIRVALNAQRSWWRRVRREVLGAMPGADPAVTDTDPVSGEVRAAVAALPRRQREVVALRVIADLSAEETADVLGISPGTVGVHLHRALAALRATLPSPRLTQSRRGHE